MTTHNNQPPPPNDVATETAGTTTETTGPPADGTQGAVEAPIKSPADLVVGFITMQIVMVVLVLGLFAFLDYGSSRSVPYGYFEGDHEEGIYQIYSVDTDGPNSKPGEREKLLPSLEERLEDARFSTGTRVAILCVLASILSVSYLAANQRSLRRTKPK